MAGPAGGASGKRGSGQSGRHERQPRHAAAMFISIDGGDGTGKSTQAALLCEWLRGRGHDVVPCRDPGSTPLGEAVRGMGAWSESWNLAPPGQVGLH